MFFDCDCLLGRPTTPIPDVIPSPDDLITQMEKLRIDSALVRYRACIINSPESGNAQLLKDISGCDNLIPAFFVTPDGLTGAWDPVEMVEQLIAAGARAGWIQNFEDGETFILDSWCAGEMLDALQQHRLPLLINYSYLNPTQLHNLLNDFPDLPVILLQVPRMGRLHHLYRLLSLHSNLHLCIGGTYAVHFGIEDLVGNFGSKRFLFGSGYPSYEGGMSVAMLMYAGISDEDKQAIASGNLQRLIAEVRA